MKIKKDKNCYKVKSTMALVLILCISILIFACSKKLQNDDNFNETEINDETIIVETTNQQSVSKKISIKYENTNNDEDYDIEGYKEFRYTDSYSYYDDKENVWKDGNSEKTITGNNEFVLTSGSFLDEEVGSMNIENYIKRIEEMVLSLDYVNIDKLDLSKEPFYNEDLSVIIDENKKIVSWFWDLDFDKEKKIITSIWIRGYLFIK